MRSRRFMPRLFVAAAIATNYVPLKSLRAQDIPTPSSPTPPMIAPDMPQSQELSTFVGTILESLAQGRFYKNGDTLLYSDKAGRLWKSEFRDAQTFTFERRTEQVIDVPENKIRPHESIHSSQINSLTCLG